MPTQQEQGLEHVTLTTACQKLADQLPLTDKTSGWEDQELGRRVSLKSLQRMEQQPRILLTLASGLLFLTFSAAMGRHSVLGEDMEL